MKEEAKEAATRIRKVRAANGQRSQTAMTFRIDNDIVDWLQTKTNKGRTVNDALRGRMKFETTMD